MKTGLALLICLLASCAGLQKSAAVSLVGEWQYTDKIQSCYYVFKEDGSFRGEVTFRGRILSKFTGRWSVSDSALLYEYTNDVLGRIPVGTRDRDKLLSVEKDSFAIEAADGNHRRYIRIAR